MKIYGLINRRVGIPKGGVKREINSGSLDHRKSYKEESNENTRVQEFNWQ